MFLVSDRAREPYEVTWQAMRERTDHCTPTDQDELWLVEHDPVFTLGQGGKASHLLTATSIPLVRSDRGGQITYHGPGQLIVYVLLNLKRRGLTIKTLVSGLELSLIKTLDQFDLSAHTTPGAPGVYINSAKIASVGLRIRRGFSYHGLALNVDGDLSPFAAINPCGYPGLKMVQLKEFIPNINVADVKATLIPHLQATLQDTH